jgi:hypothetical protein
MTAKTTKGGVKKTSTAKHKPVDTIHHELPASKHNRYGLKDYENPQTPPPIMLIVWEDAIAIGDPWEHPTDTHNHTPEPTVSIGYLWTRTDTHHTLVNTLNTEHIGGGILIPNTCIITTRTLT